MHRKMYTKDIKIEIPAVNMLNTTLVTHLEVVEDGVLKYSSNDINTKVYAMLSDTSKKLRIIINHQNK